MRPGPFAKLAVPLARQVDALCDRFDRACVADERPQIEDYLRQAPAEARTALLWELVRVELWYRRTRGERPTLDEYRRRFPEAVRLPELFPG
jgi:hypothetical protein